MCCLDNWRVKKSHARISPINETPSSFCFSLSPIPFPVLRGPSRPLGHGGTSQLRHSLGTRVPGAERAPLQPLTSQQPGPASWYSGLCPCLPGTVSFLLLSAAPFPPTPAAQGSWKAMHEMLQGMRELQAAPFSSSGVISGEQNHSLELQLALV